MEQPKNASARLELPEVTDEPLQGLHGTAIPGKLKMGQMGIRWRKIQMFAIGAKLSRV